jgi:hypothetical protein
MIETKFRVNCEYFDAVECRCNHWTAPPFYRFGVLIRTARCILETKDERVACCKRSPYPRPMPAPIPKDAA